MKLIIVAAACAAVVLAGCGQLTPNHHYINHGGPAKPTSNTGTTASKASPKTWHIAGFTVKELPLPANYKPNENQELIVGTTLLKMASKSPYTVTWQSLTSKRPGIVIKDGCPDKTLSAYADLNDGYNLNGGYAPGYAGFVCVGRERSQLTLVHVPDMKVSIFPLPGYAKHVQDTYGEYLPGARIFGSPNHQYLSWTVWISESSNANLGSGIVDMTTGKPVAALPVPFNEPIPVLASPNDTLYTVQGHTLSEWNGTAFKALGTIEDLRLVGVDDSGVAWADQPSPSNVFEDTIIRETPGSTKAQSWNVVGTNLFIGPGFVSYTPGESLYGLVKIFFPEADRTLTINNVYGQPLLAGFQRANDQVLITTSVPPVVIEIIPPS